MKTFFLVAVSTMLIFSGVAAMTDGPAPATLNPDNGAACCDPILPYPPERPQPDGGGIEVSSSDQGLACCDPILPYPPERPKPDGDGIEVSS